MMVEPHHGGESLVTTQDGSDEQGRDKMVSKELSNLIERGEDENVVLHFDRMEASKEGDQLTMTGVIELGGDTAQEKWVRPFFSNRTGGIGGNPVNVIGRPLEFTLTFDCEKGVGTIKIA